MRAARLTGFVVLAVAALAALAVALLTWLVDAGRFRPQIEAAVQSATGRPLRIAGGVDLDVLPFVGIAVRDATLGNPPGFSTPTLLHVDELTLGARLLPLLRGRFELTRVRLTGVQLQLERRADGRANWEGLAEAGSGGGDAGAARFGSLEGIELRDATLRYADATSGSQFELDDLEADIAEWAPGQPLRFTARAQWTAASRPAWPVEASGRLTSGEGRSTLDAGRFTLLWRTKPDVAGLPLQLLAPRIELDTRAGLVLGGAPLELRLGGDGDGDRVTVSEWRVASADDATAVQARIAVEARSLRALLDASGIGAPYTTDARVLGPLRASAAVKQADRALAFEPVEIRLDDTTLRGRIRRGAAGPLEIELAGDRMEIARYLEPADAPTPVFRFPTAALRALEARATVTLERATLGDAQLEGVTLRLVLDEQGLRRAAAPKAATP